MAMNALSRLGRFYIGLQRRAIGPLPDGRSSWRGSVAIKHKTALRVWLFVAFGVALVTGATVHGEMTVDDFENYQNGQIVGPGAVSSPWRRFGSATNDHVMATIQDRWLISGDVSGVYGLVWPNSFGAIRRAYDSPFDLGGYNLATIKIQSGNHDTHTLVRLAISNGHTTFVTVVEYPLTKRVQELTFELGMTKMIRVVGEDTYDDVVGNIWNLGFDFRNTEDKGFETVSFDDFILKSGASQEKREKRASARE